MFDIKGLQIVSVIKIFNSADQKNTIKYDANLKWHELIYHFSGRGTFVLDDTVGTINADQIIFLPKGKHHTYRADIEADGECIDIFFEADEISFNHFCSINCKENKTLSILFSKLYYIWHGNQTGFYNKSMSLFYSILYEMELQFVRYVPKSKGDRLNAAVDFIHQHYSDHSFSYESLPKLCGIGYTYFKKLFKERFGMLPSEYVRDLRIRRACELLNMNKLNIMQIADQCGFSDPCYFSKVFKQIYGVPPIEWRGKQD